MGSVLELEPPLVLRTDDHLIVEAAGSERGSRVGTAEVDAVQADAGVHQGQFPTADLDDLAFARGDIVDRSDPVPGHADSLTAAEVAAKRAVEEPLGSDDGGSDAMDRRTALVTGGARRVGCAIVRELAERGFDVVLHHRTSARAAEQTADRVRAAGGQAWIVRADLRLIEEIDGLARDVAEITPRLDLLVHNASSFHPTPVGSTTERAFDDLLATNFKAPYFLTQALMPLLHRADDPQIVHLLDASGERPWPGWLPYCAAKAALQSLTRGLAIELAPRVRVNAVAPGPALLPEGAGEAQLTAVRDATLLRRMSSAEEVAETVGFLADGPRSFTGAVLTLDGGRRLSGGGTACEADGA